MGVAQCAVGFRSADGVMHSVQVNAESVYEAATRGLVAFQRHPWLKAELALTTLLLVQPNGARQVHRVEVRRLLAWFDGSGRDRARRFQLKRLLERPQDSPRVNQRIRAH